MWYYESNHQPTGPVSEEEISELLQTGTITALTLVWKEGMADWKHLGETELSSLSHRVAPVSPIPQSPAFTMPVTNAESPSYAAVTPKYARGNTGATPRVKPKTLKNLFTWWIVMIVCTIPFEVISLLNPNSNTTSALSCVSTIVGFAGAVVTYVLLYRLWQVNQDGRASTTPGKAVGFLFIPIFQLYWFFRAYPGLALDQNRYIAEHFGNQPEIKVRKSNPVIAFGFLIFVFIGSIVLGILMTAKTISTMNTSMSNLDPNLLTASFSVPIVIFSLITLLLSFLMYYDFYKTAMSIIEAEEKQQ